MHLTGGFVLPVPSQLEREVELDGPGTGTIVGAAAAIPAFLGMKNDGRFALLRMRDVDVNLACIHTDVASVADLWVKNHRVIRCNNIGNRE